MAKKREAIIGIEQDRIVRPKEASALTGRSLASMWRDEKAGLFPKRRRIGAKSVGYLMSELTSFLASRPVVTSVNAQLVAKPGPGKQRGRPSNAAKRFMNSMRKAGITPPKNIIADGELHHINTKGNASCLESEWYIFNADFPAAGLYGCGKRNMTRRWVCKVVEKMNDEEKADYDNKMKRMKRQLRAVVGRNKE